MRRIYWISVNKFDISWKTDSFLVLLIQIPKCGNFMRLMTRYPMNWSLKWIIQTDLKQFMDWLYNKSKCLLFWNNFIICMCFYCWYRTLEMRLIQDESWCETGAREYLIWLFKNWVCTNNYDIKNIRFSSQSHSSRVQLSDDNHNFISKTWKENDEKQRERCCINWIKHHQKRQATAILYAS